MIFVLFAANFVLALIFIRILVQIRTKINFSTKIFVQIVLFWFVISFFSIQFLKFSAFGLANLTLFVSLALIFLPNIVEKIQMQILERQILPFIHFVVLCLRTGKSLENSLSLSLQRQNSFLKQSFSAICERSRHANPSNNDFSEKVLELERVLYRARTNTHLSRQIIDSYRYKLSVEYRFSKRIAAVSAQTRAQTSISIVLYGLSLLFLHFRFGFRGYFGVIFASSALIFIGVAVSYFTSRRYQWKV